MFSIMSSIVKTWTMLNAVQANLLVSQKVIYKRGLRWDYFDKRAFKSGGMLRLCLNFVLAYFFYFLRNKLTCTFQTLTAYLHEESDMYFFSVAYQQVLQLLFCFGAVLVTPFFS